MCGIQQPSMFTVRALLNWLLKKKKNLTFTAFSVVQWSCLVALLVFCDILLAKIWMNRNMERVFYSTKAMETHLGSAD